MKNLLLPGLLLAAALISIIVFDAAEEGYQLHVPVGYVGEVDRLITEGKLVYDCVTDTVATTDLDNAERYFVANSYLRRDIAAYNGGDRRPFLIEREAIRGACDGRVVAANASYHNQRQPTYRADTWRGRLSLRQLTDTIALAAGRSLELVPPPWVLLPLPADAYQDAWFGDEKPSVRAQRLAFKMFERGRPFATLKAVGNDGVLEITGARPGVSLDGCPLPIGWRIRLENDDLVRIAHSDAIDERYRVETGRRAAIVSFLSQVNGEPRRRTLPARLNMATDVVRAIDAVVIAAKDLPNDQTPARDDFDVTLTLDAFLHGRLENELGDNLRERYGRRAVRAGMTVLDADQGRTLALASYPTLETVDRLSGDNEVRRALLLGNHNLSTHNVGSATKPFLAAAALATRDSLRSLQLPCWGGGAEPPETFLGYPLGTYNLPADCGASPTIDFADFMARSSNRYMIALGLLAMADWSGAMPREERLGALDPLDRYTLSGRTARARPRLPIVKNETDNATELADVAEEPFFRAMRDIFGARINYKEGTIVDRLDLEPWRPVFDATLGDTRHRSAAAFASVATEEVNLRANLIQQLRQDLYTLLLGAGNNRWSNLQLSEAMARLLTGKAIDARLIETVSVAAPTPEQDDEVLYALDQEAAPIDLALDDGIRRFVLDSMAGVVDRVDGTAYRLASELATLNQALPDGVRYTAYAKTGTPTELLRTAERGPSDVAPAAVETYSNLRQVKSAMLILGLRREAPGEEPQNLAISMWIEAQGGSEEAVEVMRAMLRPLVETHWPEDWLVPRE
ncbi:MAG: hypothetical protein AAGD38_19135 [Acidobacteriota bacterium]